MRKEYFLVWRTVANSTDRPVFEFELFLPFGLIFSFFLIFGCCGQQNSMNLLESNMGSTIPATKSWSSRLATPVACQLMIALPRRRWLDDASGTTSQKTFLMGILGCFFVETCGNYPKLWIQSRSMRISWEWQEHLFHGIVFPIKSYFFHGIQYFDGWLGVQLPSSVLWSPNGSLLNAWFSAECYSKVPLQVVQSHGWNYANIIILYINKYIYIHVYIHYVDGHYYYVCGNVRALYYFMFFV